MLRARDFMLLENVAHIISDNLREIPDYLLEEL